MYPSIACPLLAWYSRTHGSYGDPKQILAILASKVLAEHENIAVFSIQRLLKKELYSEPVVADFRSSERKTAI